MTTRGLLLSGAYLLIAILAGSLLAALLAPYLPVEYEKVFSRAVLLFCALGLVPLWRLAGLDAATVGLTPVALRRSLHAWLPGVLVVLPPMLFFFVVRYRVLDDRVVYLSAEFLLYVLMAAVSALLVSLFEETLFRGVLFSALKRRGRVLVGAVVVSALYASVHFLGAAEVAPVEDIRWFTGILVAGEVFAAFGTEFHWDSFISLFLLGLLLCWVRERLGLWICIGLHAAWVFAIRIFKEISVRDVLSPYASTAGTYDNFVGNVVTIWLVFLFVLIALHRQYRLNSASLPPV